MGCQRAQMYLSLQGLFMLNFLHLPVCSQEWPFGKRWSISSLLCGICIYIPPFFKCHFFSTYVNAPRIIWEQVMTWIIIQRRCLIFCSWTSKCLTPKGRDFFKSIFELWFYPCFITLCKFGKESAFHCSSSIFSMESPHQVWWTSRKKSEEGQTGHNYALFEAKKCGLESV